MSTAIEIQRGIAFRFLELAGEELRKLADIGGPDYTGHVDLDPGDPHPLTPGIGYSEEVMRKRFGAVRVKEVDEARGRLEKQFPRCRIPEYFVHVRGVNELHAEKTIDDGARVRFLWQIDQARWDPIIHGRMGAQLRIGKEVQIQSDGSLRFRNPVPAMVVCSEPLTALHQKGLADSAFPDGASILAALPAYIRSWVLPAAWHSQ